MIVKLYIYDKLTGTYCYADTGDIDYILYDLLDSRDFTLTPPPNQRGRWRWINGQWIADDAAP